MKCDTDIVPGTCGLGVLYEFDFYNEYGEWDSPYEIIDAPLGGIDYAVAGFVDNLTCKEAYEEINEHYDIVYQSPVKRNCNSGNMFFFIVFKRKES